MSEFQKSIERILDVDFEKGPETASASELYQSISKAAVRHIRKTWEVQSGTEKKRACYFSSEFLIGRLIHNNLLSEGLLKETEKYLEKHNMDISLLEDIEDPALGNGGLGRLAACYLDSAATQNIPLDGYGIRYRYGLFKQYFEDGFQKETADDWQSCGDPWSVRKEDEKVKVSFADQEVYAVPYDMPVIGYGAVTINTLRLWQAEPLCSFDFDLFNANKFDQSVKERNDAERISAVLYPNDETDEGKKLRIRQQYFFTSASLQCMVSRFKKTHGSSFEEFPNAYAVQLNDTHPVVAIPELIRILVEQENLTFPEAFQIARSTFAYTNHTVMGEALEKWNVRLYKAVIPNVYTYIQLIQKELVKDLRKKGISKAEQAPYNIVDKNTIHMARMAVYATSFTNGVAKIHTEILKDDVLKEWYRIYPERFQNKTNGITQRRWLALANPELSYFITEKIGDAWITDLSEIKKLEKWKDDETVILEFDRIKKMKKRQLAEHVKKMEGIDMNPEFIYDVQIKRLHEYKRQLLNAFSILDTYFGLKDGRIKDFTPTVYLFGAKAAPGYKRAKGIIKFINEIGRMIAQDEEVADRMQVVFVSNYNVSYAEKITPAADISEQISTAGTEASGTGNMKFMLNGAVTLGTLDGANVEIVEQAGEENNYIFGARVEEINAIKDTYNPKEIYKNDKRVRAVVDMLINGKLDDGGTGIFKELYDSLLEGASWHKPDNYFILHDFRSYCDEKLKANREFGDVMEFRKKCFLNTCNAGTFSSDRAVIEYAKEIWKL